MLRIAVLVILGGTALVAQQLVNALRIVQAGATLWRRLLLGPDQLTASHVMRGGMEKEAHRYVSALVTVLPVGFPLSRLPLDLDRTGVLLVMPVVMVRGHR